MANAPHVFATSEADPALHATTADGHTVHVEPALLGLAPFQWVSVAMLILLLVAFFGAKVHRKIAGGLDGRIAAIRTQLEEAKKLRAEAEALRDEYARRIAGAEQDAANMLANARREADAILAQAEDDTTALIARREQMATDKIAAAERAAVEELRSHAARAATAASRDLIAARHDAGADRRLVDEAIAAL
jgi:F-type H+-transporting ATPase subunit b